MKKFALLLLLALAAPARATGGLVCHTAGAHPIEVSVGFGHAEGAPLVSVQLFVDGREVPVVWPQWWLDRSELRLLLTDPNAMREESIIRARRNGDVYDGSLWRDGKRRWIRCSES